MLIGAIVVVVLVVALLAVPLTLLFRVSWHGQLEHDVRFVWAFGLVSVQLPSATTRTREPEKKRKRKRRTRAAGRRKPNVLGALRLRRFRRRVLRTLAALWRSLHKEDVAVRLRVGLGDPADTGRLWALLGPLGGVLASARELSVRLEPEFDAATFELDSSGQLRVVPGRLVLVAATLLLSPAFWQGIRTLRGAA